MSEEGPSDTRDITESSRKQKVRHSLQPIIQEPQIKDTRLTQSQGYGRRQRSKLNPLLVLKVPSIPEDEEVSKPSTPSSNRFKPDQKRKNSETKIANNRQNVSVSDNRTQTRQNSHGNAFETATQQRIQRTNSSAISITNPQVQKEQYWWFSRWSIRNKSVLIFIIIALSIIIIIQLVFIVVFRH